MNLPPKDWSKLTQNHRWVLEILNKDPSARIEPESPLSMRTAMHDLWRFGMAERSFDQLTKSMSYQITFTGRRCAQEILATN